MPGGGGGGGGGGCGGGGGGCGGGGFSSFSSGYSRYSTTCSASYNSYAGISVTRNHNASQSHSSVRAEQRTDKSGNANVAASQLNTRASVDQPQARETDQTNRNTIRRRQISLSERIYRCIVICLQFTCACCACSCCMFWFGPIPFIVFSGALSPSSTDIATNFFSPGDSRLMSFSSFFCDRVDVQVDSIATGASLFLLDTSPPLSDTSNFTITDSRTLGTGEFQFWQYYLYSDSNISVSVCSDRLDVYIVKGNSNANKWARSPGCQHAKLFQKVTKKYPQQQGFSYLVQDEDQYYIIFHNSLSRGRINYNLKLSIERFEYNIESGNHSAVCYAPSGKQCSVDITYGTGSQLALVMTSIPVNVDWGENVDVKTSCNRRDWAYTVVILPIILVLTSVVVIIVAYLICYHKCWISL